jgi:hypothetical protein
MQKDFIISPAVAAIIPHSQYMATLESLEAFAPAMVRLEEQLKKCPALGETDGKNRTLVREHPAIFHYFCGATDIYICEYDGKEEMFGFTILNGDLFNSE